MYGALLGGKWRLVFDGPEFRIILGSKKEVRLPNGQTLRVEM